MSNIFQKDLGQSEEVTRLALKDEEKCISKHGVCTWVGEGSEGVVYMVRGEHSSSQDQTG